MKKTLFIMLGAMPLMLAGTVMMACGSDDVVAAPEVPETGHEARQLPKQIDFIKTVTEIGYIKCDTWDNTWIIDVPLPVVIAAARCLGRRLYPYRPVLNKLIIFFSTIFVPTGKTKIII